jgi:hypothetical protein
MLVGYLLGIVVVGSVIATCLLARGGGVGAETASVIAAGVLAGFAWIGAAFGLFLMLAAPQMDREDPIHWWSPGPLGHAITASLGALVATVAAMQVSRGRYDVGSALLAAAAFLFALWGLILGAWA